MEITTQLRVRSAVVADIPAMLDLERQAPAAAHWPEQQYRDIFQTADDARRLVLILDDGTESIPIGFLIANRIAPEWELENIVVAPHARQKGLGKRLLDELLSRARVSNSEAVFLEVRESNLPARALYEKCAFQQTGRRKSYYANPMEDAILYRRIMP